MKIKSPFYSSLLAIAIPIMLQNLLASSVSFVDTLMIGQLGSDSIAAVGTANQVFFLVNLFAYGIASGVSVFLSRYYGANNLKSMEKITAFGLVLALIGGSLWALASLFGAEEIMHFFTYQENVVEIGSLYQRIVSPSYIFFAVSLTLSICFRATGQAKIPLKASILSLTTNCIGNYLLIFGIGPFPALGVAGAAISTLFARTLELVLLIYYVLKNDMPFRIKSKEAFVWKKAFLISYMTTSLPVFLNETLWSLGMTFYKIAYSRLGVDALASVSVIEAITNLFFVAMLGIGNASTVLIGNSLGKGNIEETVKMSKRLLKVSYLVGLLMGILMAITAPFIPKVFNIEPHIYHMITSSLFVLSIFQTLKGANTTAVVGIFRGGADTKFALCLELGSVYFIGIPLSFLAAVYLGLPLWGVYLLQNMEEITKAIGTLIRMRNTKWIKSISFDN